MTTTASSADDEILTTEVEPRPALVSATTARGLFVGLAIAAGVALVAAVLIVVLAPTAALTWLIVALAALVLIVLAEIVLLVLARPRKG